ncbi:clarin-2-like isoform X1 [Lineus longissimus]|uniref:clarin-2-like isoform X1 n=1 Tax=Lineus longissimus TaxID=88925 RepID=UPI002B4F9D26
MMQKKKKLCLVLTGFIAALAVGLVSAALATNFWVESKPVREVPQQIIDSAKNVSGVYDTNKFKGEVHFGLFYGSKVLNYGFGESGRETEIIVTCLPEQNVCGYSLGSDETRRLKDVRDRVADVNSLVANGTVPKEARNGLFNFGLWVATIIFSAFSIAWGLVCIGFVVLNVGTKPIETLTGPMGLYLWNAFALFFTLLSVIMYIILYHVDLVDNVMTSMEKQNYWTSQDRTYLSYSFWFMVVPTGCYLLNIIIIYISGTKIKPVRYQASMKQAQIDGVMMY